MKVHILKPYALDKNLGRVYNEAMAMIPDGDWACLMDYDTCFLTPGCGWTLHNNATLFPNTGIFTCYTNRIHHLQPDQNYLGYPSDNTDFAHWVNTALELEKQPPTVTSIDHEISGFLMMVSKETWKEIKFSEDGKCLGCDNDYSRRILASGRRILRMDNLLVWHTYRINDIKDKTHLL